MTTTFWANVCNSSGWAATRRNYQTFAFLDSEWPFFSSHDKPWRQPSYLGIKSINLRSIRLRVFASWNAFTDSLCRELISTFPSYNLSLEHNWIALVGAWKSNAKNPFFFPKALWDLIMSLACRHAHSCNCTYLPVDQWQKIENRRSVGRKSQFAEVPLELRNVQQGLTWISCNVCKLY